MKKNIALPSSAAEDFSSKSKEMKLEKCWGEVGEVLQKLSVLI
jgi:hypothetical protein